MLRNVLTDPELVAFLGHITIQRTEPAAEALRPAVMETPIILDLKIKLLRAAAKGVCRAQAISGPS
jgi:hypothetical protein